MSHRRISPFCLWVIVCLAITPAALGQIRQSPAPSEKAEIKYVIPSKRWSPKDLAKIRTQSQTGSTIAAWGYSITGYDSKPYSGVMVGRSPFFHGHRVTTIPTFLIPLKFTFADSGTVFDASTADPCAPGGVSVQTLIQNSPLFQNSDFILNGADVGTTQYVDAFQRANFWTLVSGTPYHTVFSTTPTVLPAVSVTVPAAHGVTCFPSGNCTQVPTCGAIGEMDYGWWDNYVQTTIIPSLAAQGVSTTSFPQFITDNVFELIPSCCALGYHNGYFPGGVFQSYSVNAYDTSGTFGGDTSVMSHEIAEWMDDPAGSNAVPSWGAEGQVPAGSCQGNLEVGDPLTGTLLPPVTLNGVTYNLQELTFFSWFYGGTSLGSGGVYSSNGTFKGFAKACPPGGTN